MSIIEISSGFITIAVDDWLRLIEKVQKSGLKAKPEVGIQFEQEAPRVAKSLKARACALLKERFCKHSDLLTPEHRSS